MDKRLYLRVGDRVLHQTHEAWGEGRVVQTMTSVVSGGTSLVRIEFQDGQQRTFGNDLDADTCCYFFGIRRAWDTALASAGAAATDRRRPIPRRLPGR